MSYSEKTLNDLFNDKNLPEAKSLELEAQSKCIALKEKLEKKKSGIQWNIVTKEIVALSPELLNIQLQDILKSAWAKYDKISEYLVKGKFDPEEIFLIPLVEHTIISEHSPKIEVKFNEAVIEEIKFQVYIELLLKGLILKIKDGEIEGVKAGSCQCKGSFSCENVQLFECKSEEFIL